MSKLGKAPRPEAFARARTTELAKAVRDEANAAGRLTEAGARRIAERTDRLRHYGDDARAWLESHGQKSVKADKLIGASYAEALAAGRAVAGDNDRISLAEAESLPPRLVPEFFAMRGKEIPRSVFAKRAKDAAPELVAFVLALRDAQGSLHPSDTARATEFFDKATVRPASVPAGLDAHLALELAGPAAKNVLGGRYLVLLDDEAKIRDLVHEGPGGLSTKRGLPAPSPETAAGVQASLQKVLADYGLGGIHVDIDPTEVLGQAAEYGGSVGFEAALRGALDSLIEDGSRPESPRDLIGNIGSGPWPEGDPSAAVRWLLSRPSTALSLVRQVGEEPPPPEDGESVSDAWVFYVSIPELSDHGHWAVVDRGGDTAPYNYGFN